MVSNSVKPAGSSLVTKIPVLLAVYGLHVAWLSVLTVHLRFPSLLRLGPGVNIAAENIYGVGVIVASAVYCRKPTTATLSAAVRPLPWQNATRVSAGSLIETAGALLGAYLLSGYANGICDWLLTCLVAVGVPLTRSQCTALQVLLSHATWMAMAARVLHVRLRPFFPRPLDNGQWFRISWKGSWLRWTLIGYFASLLVYNAVDALGMAVLRLPLPGTAGQGSGHGGGDGGGTEALVDTLLHPADHDLLALAIGSIAPCLTAPVFEEVRLHPPFAYACGSTMSLKKYVRIYLWHACQSVNGLQALLHTCPQRLSRPTLSNSTPGLWAGALSRLLACSNFTADLVDRLHPTHLSALCCASPLNVHSAAAHCPGRPLGQPPYVDV